MRKTINIFILLIICASFASYAQLSNNNKQDISSEKTSEELAAIAGKSGGAISKEFLLKPDSIVPVNKSYKIVSFDMMYNTDVKKISWVVINVIGNKLNFPQIGFSALKSGYEIYFKNIKAIDNKGKTIILKPITFTLI